MSARTPASEREKQALAFERAQRSITLIPIVSLFPLLFILVFTFIYISRSQKREREKWRTLSGLSYMVDAESAPPVFIVGGAHTSIYSFHYLRGG
jgi:preprotein translocase subunit YajC